MHSAPIGRGDGRPRGSCQLSARNCAQHAPLRRVAAQRVHGAHGGASRLMLERARWRRKQHLGMATCRCARADMSAPGVTRARCLAAGQPKQIIGAVLRKAEMRRRRRLSPSGRRTRERASRDRRRGAAGRQSVPPAVCPRPRQSPEPGSPRSVRQSESDIHVWSADGRAPPRRPHERNLITALRVRVAAYRVHGCPSRCPASSSPPRSVRDERGAVLQRGCASAVRDAACHLCHCGSGAYGVFHGCRQWVGKLLLSPLSQPFLLNSREHEEAVASLPDLDYSEFIDVPLDSPVSNWRSYPPESDPQIMWTIVPQGPSRRFLKVIRCTAFDNHPLGGSCRLRALHDTYTAYTAAPPHTRRVLRRGLWCPRG